MRGFFAISAVAIGAVALGGAAVWGLTEFGYRLTAHYAPLGEQVRRDTFEGSRAFREGTVRDLENLQMDYAQATPAGKVAIRSVALHRLADVPSDLLTPDLRAFAAQLRSADQ